MKSFLKKHLHIYIIVAFVILLCVIGSGFGLSYVSKHTDVYPDFLVGYDAYYGGNKTGEWKLMWGITFIGILITIALTALSTKFFVANKSVENRSVENNTAENKSDENKSTEKKRPLRVFAFTLPIFIHILIYGKTTMVMCLLTLLLACLFFVYKETTLEHVVLFICEYFFVQVVFLISFLLTGTFIPNDNVAFIIGFLVFIISEWMIRKEVVQIEKVTNVFQIGIPFLFLLYLKNTYSYEGQIVKMAFPKRYVGIIVLLIGSGILYNLYSLIIKRKNKILCTTVFSVFAYVSYMVPAMMMQYDLHHHGEQLLPWQQIVELSQKAYATYYPASGFYPMILGAINQIVFHGQANCYAMSYVLFALIFEFMIMVLLYQILDEKWCICIAVLFHMPVYCRTWMLLPVILLLINKRLIRNRIYWMICCVFSCFLSGLYYPIFGVATLLVVLPFFIYQFSLFIKKKEYKKLLFARYYVPLILVMILVVFNLPLLFRMVKQILLLSDQTLLVDGVPVLKTTVQEWFMPYVKNEYIRNFIYHFLRFNLGTAFVLLFVSVLTRILCIKPWKKIEKEDCVSLLCMSISIPVVLLVGYTYTMIIMDEHWVSNLLSRSSHIIVCMCGVVGFLLFYEFGQLFVTKKGQWWGCAFALSLSCFFFFQCQDYMFPTLAGSTNLDNYVFFSYDGNFKPYDVSEQYVLLSDEVRAQYPNVDFSRIGEGFVQKDVLSCTEKYEIYLGFLRGYDPDIQILGFEQNQIYYYLLNEKAVYSGRTSIARSKKSVEKVLQQIDPQHTVVRGGVDPLEEYYLYHYLLLHDYVYCEELELYLPQELFEAIFGYKSNLKHSTWDQDVFCESEPYSFYASDDFMNETYKEVSCVEMDNGQNQNLCLQFSSAVSGSEAEFIRIRLKTDKKMEENAICYISFYEDETQSDVKHTISFYYDQGKWVVPMGIMSCWFEDKHSSVEISIEDSQGIVDKNQYQIVQMEFFDLNE